LSPRVPDLSRRRLLRGAALFTGGGLLISATSAGAAQAKLTQTAANYQPTPKGSTRCNNCNQWLAPTDCKTVQSPVSATGWCSLYAAKW
jgi:uncharacterized protein with PIN domain